jgi:predicted NUDIX family phosphoesterase
MKTFLTAAQIVLEDAKKPLTPHEITLRAVESRLIESHGQTPSQTMKSKLSTDILRHRDNSVFMRTEAGKFGLRKWRTDGQKEYVAQRYAKALLHEDAMVLPARELSRYAPRPGLWPVDPAVGGDLLRHCYAMQRLDAESDPSVIQLVSGFVVQHQGRVLTYKRTRRLPEVRLHGEYSCIFGGHLNPDDISIFNIFLPEHFWFMDRELNEELRLEGNDYRLELRGLLYDDARPVSRQHLAIVFDVHLQTASYTVGERGFLQQDKFESWEEIGTRLPDFENWSQTLYRLYRDGANDA